MMCMTDIRPAKTKLLASMAGKAARACLSLSVASLLLAAPAQAQMINAFKDPVAPAASGGAARSGPDLSAVSPAITGGSITIGATAYVVALFKNNGSEPVEVQGINLYPSSTVTAQVSLNKCAEAPLPPEAECAVTVAVTGVKVGAWRVEILLDHNGRTRLATTAMTGDVAASAEATQQAVGLDIEALPDKLDFASSAGNSSMVRSILLRNKTGEKIAIDDIIMESNAVSGFTYSPQCPEELLPAETCSVVVNWTPTTRGVSQGVLLVNHSGVSRMTQVEVTGTFAPEAASTAQLYPETVPERGLLVSDKDSIDFGTGINGAAAISISLVNTGSSDLTLRNIKLSGSDSGLSIARTGCRAGTVLKPVEACALTINWVPSREGTVVDDLQIHHTGARGVLILPVRGAADGAVSRESLAIRQMPADISSDPEMVAGMNDAAESVAVTPVLDGYVVTSLSGSRAVVNGPVGSLVVRDGEDVVISGVKWTVTVISTGVILTSAADEILLVFDKSLKPTLKAETSGASSGSGSASSGATSSTGGTSALPTGVSAAGN